MEGSSSTPLTPGELPKKGMSSRTWPSDPDMSLSAAIAWAFLSCAGFGCGTYIVSQMNTFDDSQLNMDPSFTPWYKMGLVWLTSMFACVPVLMKMLLSGDKWFSGELHWTRQFLAILLGVAAGLLNIAALVCTLYAFDYDPINTGPLAALMTGDVVMYAVIGHFFFPGEQLVPKQWSAMVLLMLGLGCLGYSGTEGGHNTPLDDGSVLSAESQPILAIMYAVGSLLSYLGFNVAIQVGEMLGLTNLASFVLRTGSIGFTGLVIVTNFHWRHQLGVAFLAKACMFYHFLPIACGLSEIIASYALGMAFLHPKSSIMASIIGSNPVIVLLLAVGIDRMVPSVPALLGMTFAVSSCFALAFLADKKEATPTPIEGNQIPASGRVLAQVVSPTPVESSPTPVEYGSCCTC